MSEQARRGGVREQQVGRSRSTTDYPQPIHATTAVLPEGRLEREKQLARINMLPLPSDEWNRSPHAGKTEERSMVRFVSTLSTVLITGGLAGLFVWMTLNEALEGRASAGQIWLGLVALGALLALLAWFKSFIERWQDTV